MAIEPTDETSQSPSRARARSRRTPYGSLNRDRIMQVALRVVDRDGVDGLTMRKLGAELGADPMAAYGHFANKAELLDAIVEAEAARLAAFDGWSERNPIELTVAVALHNWDVVQEHPNLALLLTSRPLLLRRDGVARMQIGVHVARAMGVPDDRIPAFTVCISDFVFGAILRHASMPFQYRAMGHDFVGEQRRIQRELERLPDDTTLERAAIDLRLEAGSGRECFELGLRALLAHFATNTAQPLAGT